MAPGTAVADGAVAFPGSVHEALRALAARPDATLVAGGTEVMALVNAGALYPTGLIVIDRIDELRGVWFADREIVLGAATTCADLMHSDVRGVLPALSQAARAVGAPGLRSRATLGGNLLSGKRSGGATAAAPGRDLLTVLVSLNAVAVCRSAEGWRQIQVTELYARDGGVDLRPGELLTALRVPISGGPQGFMKVGTRGGAARALVTFALAADLDNRTVTCSIGGFSPAAVRVDHAGQWLAEHVDWDTGAIPDPQTYPRFARLIAEGLMVPGSAGPAGWTTAAVPEEYRQQAVETCARRALVRALPPAGWLAQVAEYQQRAEFARNRAAVERAERGLPPEPPVPHSAAAGQRTAPGAAVPNRTAPLNRTAAPDRAKGPKPATVPNPSTVTNPAAVPNSASVPNTASVPQPRTENGRGARP